MGAALNESVSHAGKILTVRQCLQLDTAKTFTVIENEFVTILK